MQPWFQWRQNILHWGWVKLTSTFIVVGRRREKKRCHLLDAMDTTTITPIIRGAGTSIKTNLIKSILLFIQVISKFVLWLCWMWAHSCMCFCWDTAECRMLHGCPACNIPQGGGGRGSSWTLERESVEQGRQDSGDYPLLGALLSLLESPIPSPNITVPQTKAVLRIKSTLCQFLPPNCPKEAPYLSETSKTSSKWWTEASGELFYQYVYWCVLE